MTTSTPSTLKNPLATAPPDDANIAALLYLVSGVLFILALRGLSHPSSSRQGNMFGMVGMGIAVVTTLAVASPSDWVSWLLIIGGLGLGGGIGAYMARTVKMTDMPQLVVWASSWLPSAFWNLMFCAWEKVVPRKCEVPA